MCRSYMPKREREQSVACSAWKISAGNSRFLSGKRGRMFRTRWSDKRLHCQLIRRYCASVSRPEEKSQDESRFSSSMLHLCGESRVRAGINACRLNQNRIKIQITFPALRFQKSKMLPRRHIAIASSRIVLHRDSAANQLTAFVTWFHPAEAPKLVFKWRAIYSRRLNEGLSGRDICFHDDPNELFIGECLTSLASRCDRPLFSLCSPFTLQ